MLSSDQVSQLLVKFRAKSGEVLKGLVWLK